MRSLPRLRKVCCPHCPATFPNFLKLDGHLKWTCPITKKG